ncbi:MAG: hypothetical protein JWN40_5773 [Phycisphaerales bacterium]|nr:hypothetical protein [Phycisphaerales bacterium]
MFSKATETKCVVVLVALAVFARATRFQGLAWSERATAYLDSTNRDKSGA